MNTKEILAEHKEKFISVYEVVSTIKKSESDADYKDIAKALLVVFSALEYDIETVSVYKDSSFPEKFSDPGYLLRSIMKRNGFDLDPIPSIASRLVQTSNYLTKETDPNPKFEFTFANVGWVRSQLIEAFEELEVYQCVAGTHDQDEEITNIDESGGKFYVQEKRELVLRGYMIANQVDPGGYIEKSRIDVWNQFRENGASDLFRNDGRSNGEITATAKGFFAVAVKKGICSFEKS